MLEERTRIQNDLDVLAALAEIKLTLKSLRAGLPATARTSVRERPRAQTGAPHAAGPAAVLPTRVSGDWPGNVRAGLVGRTTEAADLSRILADPATSVISVRGRPGIGKSDLTSHVLHEIQHGRWPHGGEARRLDGVALLSGRQGCLSLDLVIERSAALLGERGRHIDAATTLTVEAKVASTT